MAGFKAPPIRYRLPGKGQPTYTTDKAIYNAAVQAEKDREAAESIRDGGFVSNVPTGKPKKPKAKAKKAARPRVATRPRVTTPSPVDALNPSGLPASSYTPTSPSGASPSASTGAAGYRPMTYAEMLAQAQKLANAAINPQINATNAAYDGTAATNAASYEALAKIQEGIAPRIEETYANAAGSSAAFAKGFSSAFQAASDGSAKDINDFLEKQGSPQQVQGAGAAGADVLYGLGGFIPASTLNREGAAFTAAAQNLPGTARSLGVDATKASEAQRLAALKELGQQRPAVLNQFLEQIRTNDIQQQGLEINRQIAGVEAAAKAQQQSFNNALAFAKTFGYDPTSGQLTLQGKKFVTQAKTNQAKKLSPSRYAALKEKGGKAADLFYYGDEKKGVAGLDYQTALMRLMKQYSLKLVDAQEILNTYYKPGEDGRPWLSFQQRSQLARAGVSQAEIEAAMWDQGRAQQILSRIGG